jgi:hypothetical protein
MGRAVPASWFKPLVAAGSAASIILQIAWLSGWTVLPLAVDAALLWLVFSPSVMLEGLFGRQVKAG